MQIEHAFDEPVGVYIKCKRTESVSFRAALKKCLSGRPWIAANWIPIPDYFASPIGAEYFTFAGSSINIDTHK